MKLPTKTEQLLFGPEGASGRLNPFRLERDLIRPDSWRLYYDQMTTYCQHLIDIDAQQIGIGWNDEIGWFVLCCGQGPFLVWAEKENV
jgi:hypothetical protein